MGTRYTAETLERLQAIYPGVRFVWLMGADNLAQFHRWDRWEWIMQHVPIGVLARPGVWCGCAVKPGCAGLPRSAGVSEAQAKHLGWLPAAGVVSGGCAVDETFVIGNPGAGRMETLRRGDMGWIGR